MATGMFENETSGNCLQQQPPGVPDSPDSIPLPDSPPPETEERVVGGGQGLLEAEAPDVDDDDGRNNNNNSEGVVNNMPLYSSTSSSMNNLTRSKKSGRRPRLAEEYDPSEPLTSSDEEEHSLLLIEGGRSTNRNNSSSINTHKETNSSSSNSILDMGRPSSPPVRPYRLSTTPPPLATSKTSSSLTPSVSNKVAELKSSTTLVANSNTNSSNNNNTINTGNSASSSNNTNRLDLSTIPVPPEENRRPVIHFSIPTRHRLLPMSSLMKRQKGGARKDGKGADGAAGSQSDGFKGLEKSQDGDEDDEDDDIDDSNRPKISLVAEIFGGTDDEDENNDEETESAQQQPTVQSEDKPFNDALDSDSTATIQNNGLSGNENQQQPIQSIDANSGRWKLVADEPTEKRAENESVLSPPPHKESGSVSQQPSTVLQTEDATEDPAGEDEPEIIEIVTLNVPPPNRLRPLRRRPFIGRFGLENGGEPEVIDIDKDDDEPPQAEFSAPIAPPTTTTTITTTTTTTPTPPTTEDRHQRRSSMSPPRRSSSGIMDISTNSEGTDRERRVSRSSPGESSPVRPERHFKRPHSSSSMSNCEEGEIIDQVNPNKKRKKDKKKKTKRRKRSKDSMTPPPSSSKLPEKRLSDSIPPPASTSDHEENVSSRGGGGAISWRKPSKRTQNRNYRDGKPKADDTFFREKEVEEKQKSSSPAHRRNRTSGRKERSPVKEKSSSGRHRRDGSPKNNRSHSKSPVAGRTSRSRSRSSGRPYRSRRRNRHSRSKSSNSVSDKSRSARSSSRRRSRRRYRRSTSRHHAGDSRSPSYITEPIRSRSSHYSKLRGRSRTRSRDRHARGRHRNKRSVTRSRTPSPRGHKKTRKPESMDRQQKKRQIKEKEKEKQQQQDEVLSDSKERRREKDKLKEKEKRRKKEKPKEEEKSKQVKEKPKEKEKKKKKKRREKSPTPVKAIVADGDSIVVSLSFQKGKTASSASNPQPSSASNEERKENGLDTSENSESTGKPKPATPAKNTGNNDAAESIIEFHEEQEHSHSSPAKLSSATDEDGSTTPPDPNASERTAKGTKSDDKGTEAAKVTSTGGGSCGSTSPFETERSFSAAPDSTKIATPQPSEQQDSSFNHSLRSSVSPTTDGESNAQGDSLVTSTGDSMDQAGHGTEDEAKSTTSSTPSKQQTDSTKHFSGLPHKIAASSASPRGSTQTSSASSDSNCGTATTASTSNASTSGSTNSTLTNSSQSSVTPVMTRPLIGNIPGLYPSTAIITGGAIPVPPPIVIPTPPPPRILYTNPGGPSTTPMLNANVLASVASALLAVRQNQPNFSGKMQATGNNSSESTTNNTQLRHMNVLGPKTQNFSLQSNFRSGLGNSSFSQGQDVCGGGGESPMSPNSSEGDDLFEPPTDRPQSEGGKIGKNGQLFGGMPVMVGGTTNANDSFNSASGGNKPKDRNNLFDTLFGVNANDSKKSVVNKPEKMSKAKVKHRKGAPKKETIKVNTSGGLTEGELRLTDEVPTSAVELIVKQKYLKKLNRQERVIEEVKVALKPYYSKRQVNKDEYKEILRRAVPKICHNKTGEINPGKIKELVEAYVKKFRHARKRGLDLSSVK